MAEVESRRDERDTRNYSGGGGGRHFNKRKRGREDDELEQNNYRNQRHRQGEAPPGTRIRRALLEIAEDALRLPHETATYLATLTVDNYDDEYVKETVSAVTLKLVVEQPFKIPFVAAVILFAADREKEVARDVVSRAGEQLQHFLEQGLWRETKLMLRFLACLSRLFAEDGVVPLLDELFNRAVDLQTASQEDVVGIELVKIILLTIPYLLVGAEDASLPAKAAGLLEKTEIVATAPHALESLVDPYPPASDDAERVMTGASVIALLQRQLQDESANNWPLKCIPRVYDPALTTKTDTDTNGDANGSTTTIAFPSVTVPASIAPGPRTLFPEPFFSLYADQEVPSVPATSDIASTLLRDAIVDTLNLLSFNRNSAARFLSELDCFFPASTFVARGTAFDKLRSIAADTPDRPTWKPEDVVIDAIFSQTFSLPAPEHRLVYYHSVITEICKISPGAFAPSLGRAIRFLFRELGEMDLELGYRYLDWFAHHLSNFEFRWKWTEWVPDIALPPLDPKKAFITGVLDKEIRLSFAKRIRETLPQPYHPLIPVSKEKDIPDFKFALTSTPFSDEGREVLDLIKKRAPEEEVQRVLDAVQQQAAARGWDGLVQSTDVYVTAILSIGSKSNSHVLSTIDRCKERLLAIGPQSDAARRQIIASVFAFWADHPGTAVNIVDKLLNFSIVTPLSVIQWALTDSLDDGRALAKPYIYELVSTTMRKVTNRLHQLLAHREDLAVPYEQRKQIDDVFPRERDGMRELFAAIEGAVAGVVGGEQKGLWDEEVVYVRAWAARWARTWRRKAIVEEAMVGEDVVGPLKEAPPEAEKGVEAVVEVDMDQIE